MNPMPPPQQAFRTIVFMAAWLLAFCPPSASEPPSAALLQTDTDGDGQPDVAKWFTGTDLSNATDAVRVEELRRLSGPDRLEITWSARPGRRYRIESWPGSGIWQPVSEVTAAGLQGSHALPFPAAAGRMWLRITTPYDASRPPFLSRPQSGQSGPLMSAGFITLTVHAYHPDGLSSVELRDHGLPAGQAARGPDGEWVFQWPADPSGNGQHQFTVVAATASGLVQESSAAAWTMNIAPGEPLTGLPGQFVKLGTNGLPLEAVPLLPDTGGQLPPFEWRPCGRGTTGGAAGLALRFPAGAKVVRTGPPRIEFNRVQLRSAPGAALQPAGIPESLTPSQSLLLGPVTVAQLVSVFALDSAQGVPLLIFGVVPANLMDGTFDHGGLRAPSLRLAGPSHDSFPLIGGYAEFSVDFTQPDVVSLPFFGTVPLPDAGNPALTLTIEPAAPAWVAVERSGRVSISGAGMAKIGSEGPVFMAELTAGESHLGVEVSAGGLQHGLAAALGPSLPPAETLTAVTSAAELENGTRLLRAKVKAYERYAAGFAAVHVQPGTSIARRVRHSASGALEALAQAKFAGGNHGPSPVAVASMARAGRAAAAAPDFGSAIEHWMTLERLHVAGFSPPELAPARTEARAALMRNLQSTRRRASLDEMDGMFLRMAERLVLLRQAGGADDDATLYDELRGALDRAVAEAAASMGVAGGVFDAAGNAELSSLDPDGTRAALSHLAGALLRSREASLSGTAPSLTSPSAELASQLGQRVEPESRRALDDAERAGDSAAFLFALERYTDLHVWLARGIIPSRAGLNLLPPDGLFSRYAVLDTAWDARHPEPLTMEKDADLAARLTRIRKKLAPGVNYPAAPFQRAFARLRSSLDGSFPLPAEVAKLKVILVAGTEHARLRDCIGEPSGAPAWETTGRLSAVVSAFISAATAAGDLTGLEEAAQLLLAEADRFGTLAHQTNRKFCLLEVQRLAAALRAMGLGWQAGSAAPEADIVLPGGLHIDEAAGGLFYQMQSGAVSGRAHRQIKPFRLSRGVHLVTRLVHQRRRIRFVRVWLHRSPRGGRFHEHGAFHGAGTQGAAAFPHA